MAGPEREHGGAGRAVRDVQVEIWSDVVCPWCAIGKRRFEAALARFEHRDEVVVRWRSFELDPTAPRERPGPLVEHLAGKYGAAPAQAREMIDRMTATAAADGWAFRLDRARGGNTVDAHRLLHLAAERGVQDGLEERLLAAYLVDGEPIGDPAALTRLAAETGLDEAEARAVLASDRYLDAVRADEAQARAYGITGVPFFVVDAAYGVSGAQPADALLDVLRTAWTAAHPPQVAGPAGDGCAEGSCAG